MRLALLIYGSLDQLSGGYLYDRRVVHELERRGHQVELIGLADRGYLPNLLASLTGALDRRLRAAKVDLVLQDELCHASLAAVNRRLRRRGFAAPIVTLLHHPRSAEAGSPLAVRLIGATESAYLRSVDAVICTSAATGRALPALAPHGARTHVALPGRDHLSADLDDAHIRDRAAEPGPLRILFLGNLIPRKGFDTLLAALARLPSESWRLTVVGSEAMHPGYVRRLDRQAARAGLNGQVRRLGPLPHAALEQLLPDMQLLALPSRHEGFGIAYLDGMGFGLPALASASGGAQDLVRHGENGFLVQPGDAAALAEHIRRLHADRARLAEMGLAARRTWESHPRWEETAAGIEAYLKEQVGPGRSLRAVAEARPRSAHSEEGAP